MLGPREKGRDGRDGLILGGALPVASHCAILEMPEEFLSLTQAFIARAVVA